MVIGGKGERAETMPGWGQGDHSSEADHESDSSFVSSVAPTIAAVTNIDRHHLDSLRRSRSCPTNSFLEFVEQGPAPTAGRALPG